MKINLTKLLEVPARVKVLNPNETNLTCSPMEIDLKTTSCDRAYSFELYEKEER